MKDITQINKGYCLCGCGKKVKSGNRYINGHNKSTLGKPSKLKGKTFKEIYGEERAKEIGKKIAITRIGDKNPAKRKDVREKISKNRKGKLTGKDNPSYWRGKKNPSQSKRMKENNPLYKDEVKEKRRRFLLKKYKDLGSLKIGLNEDKILSFIEKNTGHKIQRQYSILGYSVDGYISQLNLCIEIDEYHHYKGNTLREKDIKRQKLIEEELNCKFLRIKDNINIEELKEKLNLLK